jgi:serine/threonine-protein kinase
MRQAILGERYQILRLLDRGGMASIYVALDQRHGREVAIKVMRRGTSGAISVSRFQREIGVAAQLDHPNLLTLIDSGQVDGEPFYVMPYVQGLSLRRMLEARGRLPIVEAVRIARQIASALEHAHRHRFVHRDVKPENILLRGEHAVLLDFGVALPVDVSDRHRMTKAGMCLGTPAYMSPEQVDTTRNLDGRSDVYSLACVLFEMLAGSPPFVGPTPKAVAAAHLYELPPDLRTLRKDVPKALRTCVKRALAKLPADRFENAEAFSSALADCENQSWWRSVQTFLSKVLGGEEFVCHGANSAERSLRVTGTQRHGFLNAMHGILSIPPCEDFTPNRPSPSASTHS